MSERSLNLRSTKTPPELISQREGPQKKILSYVKPYPIYVWLDTHYPGWSMEVDDKFSQVAGFIYVTVVLNVIEPTGIKRTIKRQGCDEAAFNRETKELVSIPYLKAAETDALKRCVMALGGFADIYMDAETHTELVTDEDLLWYMRKVITYHTVAQTPPRTIFKQMKAFMEGVIKQEDIIKRYNLGE